MCEFTVSRRSINYSHLLFGTRKTQDSGENERLLLGFYSLNSGRQSGAISQANITVLLLIVIKCHHLPCVVHPVPTGTILGVGDDLYSENIALDMATGKRT